MRVAIASVGFISFRVWLRNIFGRAEAPGLAFESGEHGRVGGRHAGSGRTGLLLHRAERQFVQVHGDLPVGAGYAEMTMQTVLLHCREERNGENRGVFHGTQVSAAAVGGSDCREAGRRQDRAYHRSVVRRRRRLGIVPPRTSSSSSTT